MRKESAWYSFEGLMTALLLSRLLCWVIGSKELRKRVMPPYINPFAGSFCIKGWFLSCSVFRNDLPFRDIHGLENSAVP